MIQILSIHRGAGEALTNTTVEGFLAKHVFPGGALTPGKVIEFAGAARAVSTNSTDTLTPRLRFGVDLEEPGNNTAIAAGAAVDVANDDVCIVRGRIHCQDGRVVIEGVISDADAPGKLLSHFAKVVDIVPGAYYALDFTGQWSVAHADNQVQAEAWVVTEIA